MKALEILKELKENKDKIFLNSILNEAIKELEDLQNRTCKHCKYWNNDCMNLSTNTTGFCTFWGICNGDFEEDMKNNFCCNKWESK